MTTIIEKIYENITNFINEDGINTADTGNYDVDGFIKLLHDEGKSDVEITQSILKIYVSRRCMASIEKYDFFE